jgi:hypothetical protein
VSAGTAALPGLTPVGDPDTGLWAPAADTLALSVKGGEALRIDDQKRVGIGTSSPAKKLEVQQGDVQIQNLNSNLNTLSNYGLTFRSINPSGQDRGTIAEIKTYTGGASDNDFGLQFRTQATTAGGVTTKMTLTPGGSVGIGTTSPGSALEINAAAATSPFIAKINTAEAARIDSSGRLGIGTSTPGHVLDAQGDSYSLDLFGSNDGTRYLTFRNNYALPALGSIGLKCVNPIPGGGGAGNKDGLGFYASRGFTFNSSTDGVGALTTIASLSSIGVLNLTAVKLSATWPLAPIDCLVTCPGPSAAAAEFKFNGAYVGSIICSASATAYNTSSDYRLKENVTTISDGIARLKQLKPSRFNFKVEPGKVVDGFIAHEAQAVVPECVSGAKDAVDADGKPIYQGIDQSKLVPLLTAALQEAITRIETLETRITTLEARP